MTRQQYIDAVKVKLEEISPFDEPDSFIADGDDAANTVKPIISYINNSLDEATKNCLNSLPIALLHADIARTTGTMPINSDGVGIIPISVNRRFVRFRQELLKRDITAFITTEDPLYLVQQDKDVRGGVCKPVAVVSSDYNEDAAANGQLEIYSFPEEYYGTSNQTFYLTSIDLTKKPGSDETNHIASPIEEFIVLECAAMVKEILGDMQSAKLCRQQYQAKLQATLQ